MEEEKFINRFVIMVILFIFSMTLMIISPNLISIWFGWDGLGLTLYCLVIFYHNYMIILYNSGMVMVLCNRIGDIELLLSIMMMFIYGSWSIYFMNTSMKLILMMILLAAITQKSAQIPFSVWLLLAMAASTPVSALVHSSTLVIAGVYLLIRFNNVLISSMMDKILLYLSIFTMFMSGLMTNFENDLKKIIALSTLSQLGLMILSLGLNFLAFSHLLTHAIFKSLLFMCAGIMIHLMNNNQDIRFCGKMNKYIPFTMVSFYISSLALNSISIFGSILFKSFNYSVYLYNKYKCIFIMSIMSMLSLSFTVSYSVHLFYYIYFGEVSSSSFYYYKENKLMNFSKIILMTLSLISGSLLISIFFW